MPIKYEHVYTDLDENRLLARKVDEFMGIARTLGKRSSLAEEDVRYLAKWLGANKGVMDYPLIQPIADLISPDLLGPASLTAIHDELRKLTGDVNGDGISDGPTLGVYDDPPPKIVFRDKHFCFTGTFNYGQRWRCEEAVEERGGTCGRIVQCTDYLVIGAKITGAWKHSTFGNKITQAKAWQAEGHPIRIVREAHWVRHLDGTDPDEGADSIDPSGPQYPSTPNQEIPSTQGEPFLASKSRPAFGRRRNSPF